MIKYELCHEKSWPGALKPGLTQTGLYNQNRLHKFAIWVLGSKEIY